MARAKFVVYRLEPADGGGTVRLSPVTGGSPENEAFYSYTPAGEIVLSTVNPQAFEQFAEGQQFYVDFTPATGE